MHQFPSPQVGSEPRKAALRTNTLEDGSLLWAFAQAQGDERRSYDFRNSLVFSLSPAECGDLLNLWEGTDNELQFIHQPNRAQPPKKLRIRRAQDDNGRKVIFATVALGDKSITVPISTGEFRVLVEQARRSIELSLRSVFRRAGEGAEAAASGSSAPLETSEPSEVAAKSKGQRRSKGDFPI